MKKRFLSLFVVIAMVLATVGPVSYVNAQEDLKPAVSDGGYTYEVEQGELSGSAYVASTLPGFSGEGYVDIMDGSVTMNINVPVAGNYRVYLAGSTKDNTNNKWESIFVNNESEKWVLLKAENYGNWEKYEIGNAEWLDGNLTAVPITEGYSMAQGHNTVRIQANWGYAYYDRLVLVPTEEELSKLLNVISLIDALPETIQESNRYDVNYAKKAYDALSEEEKEQITNYEKLEKALKALIQKPVIDGENLIYEAEYSDFLGDGGYVDNTIAGYSGTGYAFVMTDGFEMKIQVPEAGKYRLSVVSANNGNGARCEKVTVNGGTEYFLATPGTPEKTWYTSEPGTAHWTEQDELKPVPVEGGMDFVAGENSVKILANWGYAAYDKIILTPVENGDFKVLPVITMIDTLPKIITAADKEAVQEAQNAYDALDETQRAAVVNYSDLEKAVQAVVVTDVQAFTVDNGKLVYEAEYGMRTGKAFVFESSEAGAGKAINIASGTIYLNVDVPIAGNYQINILGSTDNSEQNKADYVYINNGETPYFTYYFKDSYGEWAECRIGTENYINDELSPVVPENGIFLKEGSNLIVIRANWGYANYDRVVLEPVKTYASGDANEDTALNAKDIIRTKRIIAGVEGCSANFAADVDQNFVVDSIDAGEVRRILVK